MKDDDDLGRDPEAEHSISSGRKTNLGVALNAVTNGSNEHRVQRAAHRPSTTPSGSPTAFDRTRPMVKPAALTLSGAQSLPVTIKFHIVTAILLAS